MAMSQAMNRTEGARTRGAISERDRSGTTEGHERSDMPEGDGADSPTRGTKCRSGSPKLNEE